MRRSILCAVSTWLGAAAVVALVPGWAAAQAPKAASEGGPLRIVVGFPPGGSADTVARVLAEALRDDFKSVVVENRVGAAGRQAVAAVKAARPDGQTILVTPSGPMVLYPHVYKKLDYDPAKDFTPVSLLGYLQFAVVAGPASKAQSMSDLLRLAKAEPGKADFGTSGPGTLPHFVGVMLEQSADIRLKHVPFAGAAAANAALLAGQIDYRIDAVSETAELHRTGKARALAVTGRARDPQMPGVPTLREAGIDMVATAWFGVYAPAGLAPAVLKRLESTVSHAVNRREVRTRLYEQGIAVVGSTSSELATTQARDVARWEKPIKATGVQLD